jgi:hypothetical protein
MGPAVLIVGISLCAGGLVVILALRLVQERGAALARDVAEIVSRSGNTVRVRSPWLSVEVVPPNVREGFRDDAERKRHSASTAFAVETRTPDRSEPLASATDLKVPDDRTPAMFQFERDRGEERGGRAC